MVLQVLQGLPHKIHSVPVSDKPYLHAHVGADTLFSTSNTQSKQYVLVRQLPQGGVHLVQVLPAKKYPSKQLEQLPGVVAHLTHPSAHLLQVSPFS